LTSASSSSTIALDAPPSSSPWCLLCQATGYIDTGNLDHDIDHGIPSHGYLDQGLSPSLSFYTPKNVCVRIKMHVNRRLAYRVYWIWSLPAARSRSAWPGFAMPPNAVPLWSKWTDSSRHAPPGHESVRKTVTGLDEQDW
jgi:hypothetical protein